VPLQILLLTHRIPYPLTDGGALVTNFMLQGFLQQGAYVSLLSLNTTKHFVDVQTLPAYYQQCKHFSTINIDNRVTVFGALQNLFSGQSYHTSRFASPELNTALQRLLEANKYDVIILDNIFLQDAIATIRKYSKAKIACRIHNIEHQIWQKLAANTSNFLKKKYLQLQANRLQQIELQTLQAVDVLLLLNKNEGIQLAEMGVHTKQYVMPFGIAVDGGLQIHKVVSNQCYHLASMDWLPNIEALDWFIVAVLPKVIAQNPGFVLHIGGKHLPNKYIQLASKNIVVHAKVDDAKIFMQQHGICIVPLRSGAGIRVKILEAMANGVPVISTTIGAMGLAVQHNQNIIIADDAQYFADAICTNNTTLQRIADCGQQTLIQHYDANTIMQNTLIYLSIFCNA
jgi:polysaccharide biosynthesis protein PslH